MSTIFDAMKISSSGLAAQRLRMNVLSSNLANAQSTKSVEDGGGPYKRRDVVFTAEPVGDEFTDFIDEDFGTQLREVKVVDIHKDTKEPRRVYDPSHPHADKEGYVEMPNIQAMTEMVNMIAATRAFEANTTAVNNAKQMAMKALEIGR